MEDFQIPDAFFSKENICGHTVETKTKKLWAVELGCYYEFQRICEKYNLRYFASGGTLLGAIRHHGFIPWDDDMDVAMYYDDYCVFCRVAPNEVRPPYFFQNYLTEPGFGPGMSRIRNSNSTAVTAFESTIKTDRYNCGVFLDIFPIFGVESRPLYRFRQKILINFVRLAIAGYEKDRAFRLHNNMRKAVVFIPIILFWRFVSLFTDHIRLSGLYLKVCSSAKEFDSIGLLSFSSFNERFIWPKDWFRESVILPFEFLSIPCPGCFDEVLRKTYGDYTVFKKGGSVHTMVVCDPDVPYTVKLK